MPLVQELLPALPIGPHAVGIREYAYLQFASRLWICKRRRDTKGESDVYEARRRWLAARATRSGAVAVEGSCPSGLQLARRHAPRRTHRVPLERRGDRAGDSCGCPQNKGAHEWLKGGCEYRP